MKILSIDPGYERLGIAIIEKDIENGDKETLIHSDCIKTSAKLPFPERLGLLGNTVTGLITQYAPKVMVLEKLYFQNNQKTAMNVAQVIGALMYIAKSRGLEVFEYTPLQIKSACAGSGRADKKQVAQMLHQLIKINKEIVYDDEYDAIAVGLTHFAHHPKGLSV